MTIQRERHCDYYFSFSYYYNCSKQELPYAGDEAPDLCYAPVVGRRVMLYGVFTNHCNTTVTNPPLDVLSRLMFAQKAYRIHVLRFGPGRSVACYWSVTDLMLRGVRGLQSLRRTLALNPSHDFSFSGTSLTVEVHDSPVHHLNASPKFDSATVGSSYLLFLPVKISVSGFHRTIRNSRSENSRTRRQIT